MAGTGGFGSSDLTKGSTDVADTSGTAAGYPGAEAGAGNTPPKVSPIANNTGGGIPGGGGGGGAHAGGGAGGGGVFGALASAITDIQKGFLGASGGTPAPAPTEEKPETETVIGSDPDHPETRKPASIEPVIDLRRYLPTGDLYQGRDKGPAANPVYHGPFVDLFTRISVRMQEKCALHVLVGCEKEKP